MSKFFVGQRVRLVRDCAPENRGKTGTIVDFDFVPKGTICADYKITPCDTDCSVLYDDTGFEHVEITSRLEPLYDGNEVVSWETMRELWTPEGEPA